jgi:RNA polymerase sigma-70 factor (ECF subfamily)
VEQLIHCHSGRGAAGSSLMDEHQTRDIVRGLRAGKPDAWHALYDAFAERIWRGVARLLGPNSADVADVVQETMLAAAKSARTFDEAIGSLWAWLWGIARLQVALHFRKQGRYDRLKQAGEWLTANNGRLSLWLDGIDPTPADLLESAELSLIVRIALTELSADYESLLTAKYLDGDSVEQIASRERSTETAVRSKLARAREAFRQVFLRLTGNSKSDAEACHEYP